MWQERRKIIATWATQGPTGRRGQRPSRKIDKGHKQTHPTGDRQIINPTYEKIMTQLMLWKWVFFSLNIRAAGRPKSATRQNFPVVKALGHLQEWWVTFSPGSQKWANLTLGLPLKAAESTTRNQTGLGLNLWSAAHQAGDLEQVFWSALASVFPSVVEQQLLMRLGCWWEWCL